MLLVHVPSVSFIVQIPETIDFSWYEGAVHVGYKDAGLEASAAVHHATKLCSILLKQIGNRSILFLYTDGGPDLRLTFVSVQLSMRALFLNVDFDLLIVGRTPPNHSWRNPVERIMSIINLGLHACVGMMRKEGSTEFEQATKNANNLNALREAVKDRYVDELKSSIQPPVHHLNGITSRLELKGRPSSVFESADTEEIEALGKLDSTLERSDTSKLVLSRSPSC